LKCVPMKSIRLTPLKSSLQDGGKIMENVIWQEIPCEFDEEKNGSKAVPLKTPQRDSKAPHSNKITAETRNTLVTSGGHTKISEEHTMEPTTNTMTQWEDLV